MLRPCAEVDRRRAAVADLRLVDRQQVAGGAEVGAADDDVGAALAADHALPLEAELGGVAAADLDDQALDVDLGAALVELVDHRAHLPVERLGGGDDQRIGRRVGLDEAAGRRARPRRSIGAAAAETALAVPAAPAGLARLRSSSSSRHRSRRHRRPAAEGGAQHLRELGRVGVLQVHDPDVAGRGRALRRQVELGDQRADARHLARVGAAHDQRVAARVDQDRRRRGAEVLCPRARRRRCRRCR